MDLRTGTPQGVCQIQTQGETPVRYIDPVRPGSSAVPHVSFPRFLSIMKARWRIAAGIFLTIAVSTAVISKLQPKQYVANAQVVVEVFGPDPVAGTVNQAEALPSYLATQLDIINSERVVR